MNARVDAINVVIAQPMQAETFAFRCECGAPLRARTATIGGRGKCKTCGIVVIIPAPAANDHSGSVPQAVAPVEEAPTAVAIVGTCSVCQCTIAGDEPLTNCSACGLPYHVECWEGNIGCAAYGCRNVNLLKSGPDVSILTVPRPLGPPPLPSERALLKVDDIPWEFVLLAASVLLGLLSCVTFGLPSLLVAGGAGLFLAVNPKARIEILGLAWGIAGVSLLVGIYISCRFWS